MQTQASMNFWSAIDPDWAWAPWEPTEQSPRNAQAVAHLYRRAAFGADRPTLEQAQKASLPQVLDQLLQRHTNPTFQAASDQLAQSALADNQAQSLAWWWLHAMLNSPTPLVEKLTLFWHGHFATGADKVKESQIMIAQNRLLREHALGDWRELVQAMAQDPAMLIYLDSAVNRKSHPNENFARELMELFCLGEGHYSERDVQELARCFTGWEVRRNQFRFNPYQHDDGVKQLLGHPSIESGQQAVDVVLAQPQAARFIVAKLFRFFLADEPAPPARLLEPLAQRLMADRWQLAGTLRMLLGSQLMFAPQVSARKIRSPIDWVLNWIKAGQITTNLKKVSQALADLGQSLFYPPNVKGWDGGRAWINSSTLVGRTNFVSQLVREESTRWAGGTIEQFFRQQRVHTVAQLIDWLEEFMLCRPLDVAGRMRLHASMEQAGGVEKIRDLLVLAAALPEMQLM